MNPGMLMVERQMNLPNLTHFLVSNRAYGATSNAGLPNVEGEPLGRDRARHGPRPGVRFTTLPALEHDLPTLVAGDIARHTFVVLEVEPF